VADFIPLERTLQQRKTVFNKVMHQMKPLLPYKFKKSDGEVTNAPVICVLQKNLMKYFFEQIIFDFYLHIIDC
jgi:hypothetical protein